MQVMWHEISLDVERSEKAKNFELMLERVRNLVVELKFGENKLHQRAVKLYLQFIGDGARAEDIKEADVLGPENSMEGEPDYELSDELLPDERDEGGSI